MKNYLLIFLCIVFLTACASNSYKYQANILPKSLAKTGNTNISDVDVVLYFPRWSLDYEYTNRAGLKNYIGKYMQQAFLEVGNTFNASVDVVSNLNTDKKAGIFTTIQPYWRVADGNLILELHYRIYNKFYNLELSGFISHSEEHLHSFTETLYYNVAVRAAQKMFIDINTKLDLKADIYPTEIDISGIDATKVADLKNSVESLSGVVINANGYILGPDKSLQNCLILKGKAQEKTFTIKEVAKSKMLNLAAFKADTNNFENYAVFGDVANSELGDSLVAASYKYKDAEPALSLSFANLSANNGFKGSFKSHLISTAIQPSSPISGFYDKNGYLVGIYSHYLNYSWMVKRKFTDVNIYQMMEVEPVLKFLDREKINYSTGFNKHQQQKAVAQAKNNLVEVSCYQ